MHGFEPWTFRVLDGCSNQLSYINTNPARVDNTMCRLRYLHDSYPHDRYQGEGCMPLECQGEDSLLTHAQVQAGEWIPP